MHITQIYEQLTNNYQKLKVVNVIIILLFKNFNLLLQYVDF